MARTALRLALHCSEEAAELDTLSSTRTTAAPDAGAAAGGSDTVTVSSSNSSSSSSGGGGGGSSSSSSSSSNNRGSSSAGEPESLPAGSAVAVASKSDVLRACAATSAGLAAGGVALREVRGLWAGAHC